MVQVASTIFQAFCLERSGNTAELLSLTARVQAIPIPKQAAGGQADDDSSSSESDEDEEEEEEMQVDTAVAGPSQQPQPQPKPVLQEQGLHLPASCLLPDSSLTHVFFYRLSRSR